MKLETSQRCKQVLFFRAPTTLDSQNVNRAAADLDQRFIVELDRAGQIPALESRFPLNTRHDATTPRIGPEQSPLSDSRLLLSEEHRPVIA